MKSQMGALFVETEKAKRKHGRPNIEVIFSILKSPFQAYYCCKGTESYLSDLHIGLSCG